MDKDRIWYLMGKKVAGEATVAELAELEHLLRETPDVRYTMEVLASVWKLSEKPEDQAMAEMAFRHQWAKLESETAHQVQVAPADVYRWKRALFTIVLMGLFITVLWFVVSKRPMQPPVKKVLKDTQYVQPFRYKPTDTSVFLY